ncbi:MAG: DedA family protein [Acidobacteriota bacterium]|nr:DedA family protein [Acidobacteriota bacterium]
MGDNFFYDLVGQYGLYAIFFLAIIEGDITLLLAGVLAHAGFFGEYSFAKVLAAGTLGGVASDQIAYAMGRSFRSGLREYRFYRIARPRIERLTDKFGALSIFLSKYIYGLRWACCAFYGVGKMRYARFLPLTLASCFLWVLILSGAGYIFNVAITNLIGDFKQIGKFLLVLVVLGIGAFYFAERYWLSKKVEEADPERVQELEHAAQEKLHEIGHEIQEIGHEIQEHLPAPLTRRSKEAKQQTKSKTESGKAESD